MFNNITKMSETRFDKSLTDKVTKKLFDIDMDITRELVDNKTMERAIEDSKLLEICCPNSLVGARIIA